MPDKACADRLDQKQEFWITWMRAYSIIQSHDWNRLKSMILDGSREDMSDHDHKDYPLIFDMIHAKNPGASAMARFWLDHGNPQWVTGGACPGQSAQA